MKATIASWYRSIEPYEEEIENLQEWIEKHGGAVIVYPPETTAPKNEWVIYITDETNRFGQK